MIRHVTRSTSPSLNDYSVAMSTAIVRGPTPSGSPVPTVDQVMVEERAASFAKRSIKTSAKLSGLKAGQTMVPDDDDAGSAGAVDAKEDTAAAPATCRSHGRIDHGPDPEAGGRVSRPLP